MPSVNNTVAFQIALTTTATAQQLPANALQLGGTFKAKTGNTAAISISPAPGVSATSGFLLEAGATVEFAGNNTDQLYVVGTAADVISFLGN